MRFLFFYFVSYSVNYGPYYTVIHVTSKFLFILLYIFKFPIVSGK